MKYISTTPFGRRPVAAGQMVYAALADAPCPACPIDKWAVMRDLTKARASFQVSDRDLHVLNALLSFLPSPVLSADAPTIVFPSNARLSERLHGMPESTLRRHIAALVAAGLLLRHDSPNGKRFARTGANGQITRAFGFDLRPLHVRSNEIAAAAQDAERDEAERHALREEAILHLRDIIQLSPKDDVSQIQRMLRRKLSLGDLRNLVRKTARLASAAKAQHITPTVIMSVNDSQNERHIQDSNKKLSDSESIDEAGLALDAVLTACPESANYALEPVTTWDRLVRTAQQICPMMGIATEVWHQARQRMGAIEAAITVLCILQRFDRISRPGAYLRSLAAKAQSGSFTSGPMVRALLRGQS